MYSEDGLDIARFGRVHPSTAESYNIPPDTLYFEVEYETLLNLQKDTETRFNPISKFQSIPRELNFVMDERIESGEVAKTIDAHHPWIHDVIVDSVYRDVAKLGTGKKSVNFAFILQSHESTISDEEALAVQNSVIEKMQEYGYELRGI